MSESLRDRVARVLYEKNPALRWNDEALPFDEVRDSSQVAMAYQQAGALIAAGLVAEPTPDEDERRRRGWLPTSAVAQIAERVGEHLPGEHFMVTLWPSEWEGIKRELEALREAL